MKRKVKSIRKTMWGAYWKLHDKRKRLVARLKGYLDGLPPETRRRIMLGMLAAFAVLARNDGSRMETGHAGRVELPTPVETDNHLTPYSYGTDEE